MIIRTNATGPGFVLIRQYDHGLISGEFAHHWGWPPVPSGSALYAIAEHDLSWKELDVEPVWHPDEGRPLAFFEYPIEPRLAAYVRGIDAVERQDAYAGLLCSLHYETFVRDASGVAEASFRAAERERQSRLLFAISERERERADDELALLKTCDDLSLFVCLNPPGENSHPWYRDGLRYGDTVMMPAWDGPRTVRFEPSPFTESFGLRVPYEVLSETGDSLGSGAVEIEVSA